MDWSFPLYVAGLLVKVDCMDIHPFYFVRLLTPEVAVEGIFEEAIEVWEVVNYALFLSVSHHDLQVLDLLVSWRFTWFVFKHSWNAVSNVCDVSYL